MVAAVLSVSLLGVSPAGAQQVDKKNPLTTSDFDDAALVTVVLASFDAAGTQTLWSASGSPWGASGTLVEGDINLDGDTRINRVMVPRSDGSLLRLNDDGPLAMRDFFGSGGDGSDLTVWVQTDSGTASFAASGVRTAGSNYVNINVPASERDVLTGISAGDRFVLALTRPKPNNPATGDPAITGTAQVGETLTAGTSAIADADGITNAIFAYQWLADGADIATATSSTYTLTDSEQGKTIKVKVTFDDDDGNPEQRTSAATAAVAAAPANNPATGDPAITGTAQVGETLTASTSAIADDDGLTNVSYAYQWLADGADIAAATSSAYTLTDSEQGKAIKVKVTFDDDDGNPEERTSAATAAVAAAPAAAEAASVSEPPAGDLPGGVATTGVVAMDQPARGAIVAASGQGDSDWFAAELTANTPYAIAMLGAPSPNCTLWAPLVVGVYDDAGTLIAGTEWSHASRGSSYNELDFTPTAGGTHYIAAYSEASLTGTYIMALTSGGDGSDDRIDAIASQGCFPSAPTGLGTSDIAHNSVTLTWTAPDSAGVTGYQIWRGASAGSLAEIVADTDSTATSYTDTSAEASTAYHYAVAAITAAGAGLPSISAQTATPAKPPKDPSTARTNTPPGATGLTLAPAHDQVALTWSAPTGTVSGYKIWRGTTADSLAVLVANTNNTDTTYVDTTAEAETTYHYAVAAINSHGTGPKSAASTTTPAAPAATEEEPEPETEPLIAAQAKALEQPVVTFVSNLSDVAGEDTTIETTADNGIATHDQAFTTGSGNSLFLLDSLRTGAKIGTILDEEDEPTAARGNPFLSVSIWTDNNGSIGTELYDLGRTKLPNGHDYGAADVYLFPNTTYWIRFEVQQFTVFNQPLEETETDLHGATSDNEHTALAGWSIDGRVMVELKGREIPLGGTVQVTQTALSNLDNALATGFEATSRVSYAQGFTTGAETSGYSLDSVKLRLRIDPSSVGFTGVPVVTVHADDSGVPSSTVLHTLNGPSLTNIVSEVFTYTAPSSATLAASTTYWIKVSPATAISIDISGTADGSVARIGWSLAGGVYEQQGSQPWTEHRANRRFFMAVEIGAAVPERLESGDLPDSRETPVSVGVGESAAGSLASSSDRDWVKIDGLQNNRRYRLEVAFLGTGNIGGSFSLYSAHGGGTASGSGNLWASNWSGNAVLEFSVRDAHAKTYWVVMSPENGMNVFLRQENGQVMRDADNPGGVLAPATVHTGGYVVTLREIGHVQKFVSNLNQGSEGQFGHMVVGHRYSYGLELDEPHEDFLGYFTDYAIDFITGSHPLGYKLDRLEAQIQNGRTRLTAVSVTGEVTNRVVLSANRLKVIEGDTAGDTYTAKLSVQPTEEIVVNITGQAGTDLTVRPDTLTFTTTNWDTAQTVTVTAGADSDSVNDDITLYHNPVGEGFIVSTRAAIRVDDIENFAFVPLPPEPSSNQLGIDPRPRPLLTRDSRQTEPNPVITLWQPYNRDEGFDDKFGPNRGGGESIKVCTFESPAAVEPGLRIEGELFTDRVYAGDCADVLLKPNTRYWISFENYNEVPRYSILSSDDFYHVATATHGGQDDGAKDGWSIGDELFWRRHTTDKQDGVFQASGSMRPFMLGFHGTPMGTPDGTPVVANGTHSSWTLSVPDHHSGFVFRQAHARATATVSGATVAYSFRVRCTKDDGVEAYIFLTGTDAAWSDAVSATVQVTAGTYMETPDMATAADRVGSDRVWLGQGHLSDVLDAFEAAGTGDATFIVVLTDSSNMDTTRTITVPLSGADDAAVGVRQTCQALFGFSAQTAAPDSTDTDTDTEEAAELALVSAVVDGSTVTLTFDATLDVAAAPSKSAFTVNVNGTERSIVVLGVGGSSVLLTLSAAVESTDAVTVDYAKPDGANVIKDTDGTEAESFTNQAVTNNTAAAANEGRSESVQPPGSLAVVVSESGKLAVSWDAPGSGPAPTGYTLQWKQSTGDWATAADVSEANVKTTSHVITGLVDGTAYNIRVMSRNGDTGSDPTSEATATPRETVPPTPASAAVDATTLIVTFSEALDAGAVPDASAFAVTVAGSSRSVTAVSVSASAVTLTLASAATAGDAVTVGYTAPADSAAARLQDQAGNPAAGFAAQAVTNNTPVLLTAAVSAVPSSHSGSGTFTFELRFSEEPNSNFSYTTLRDSAFTVTGGTVTKARRLAAPSNVGWEITIRPSSNATVTIVLPATSDCTTTAAVCTQDGRMLTGRLEITIPGPGG